MLRSPDVRITSDERDLIDKVTIVADEKTRELVHDLPFELGGTTVVEPGPVVEISGYPRRA